MAIGAGKKAKASTEAIKQKATKRQAELLAKKKAASKRYEAQKRQKASLNYEKAKVQGSFMGPIATKKSKVIAEYTVKKGDTLSQIAKNYYGSGSKQYWELIQKANSDIIKDANLIYPGQVFKIPELSEEMKKR